jgi:hypothetical protein
MSINNLESKFNARTRTAGNLDDNPDNISRLNARYINQQKFNFY